MQNISNSSAQSHEIGFNCQIIKYGSVNEDIFRLREKNLQIPTVSCLYRGSSNSNPKSW